jgi:hypothetical protein
LAQAWNVESVLRRHRINRFLFWREQIEKERRQPALAEKIGKRPIPATESAARRSSNVQPFTPHALHPVRPLNLS